MIGAIHFHSNYLYLGWFFEEKKENEQEKSLFKFFDNNKCTLFDLDKQFFFLHWFSVLSIFLSRFSSIRSCERCIFDISA